MTRKIVKSASFVRAPMAGRLFPQGSTPSWALAGWKTVAVRFKQGCQTLRPVEVISYALGLSATEARRRLKRGDFLWAAGHDPVRLEPAVVVPHACIIMRPESGAYSVIELVPWTTKSKEK